MFGKTALIITYVDEFISRVKKAIKRDNLTAEYKAVEYFDEEIYHGDVGIFKKRKSLEYMKKYRIAIRAKMDNKPYILDIGGIYDISAIINSSEINNLKINVTYEEATKL